MEILNAPNFSQNTPENLCTPTISLSSSVGETPALNVNETPFLQKPKDSCLRKTKSKSDTENELCMEESISENLRAEMIALKSFVVDQIYMMKKRSNEKDDENLIKNLLNQIEFLKQELKSKDTIIKMILENQRHQIFKSDLKPQTAEESNNIFNKLESEKLFELPKKTVKKKPPNPNPSFASPNRFSALQTNNDDDDDIDAGSEQLNSNELDILNSSDSNKEHSKSRTKAPTTVILGDSIIKNVYGNAITKSIKHKKHVVVKHFSGAKIDDMKHYVKPTQEKEPAEIILHVGTNELSGNKDPDEIADEIVTLANSVKTNENRVVVSSIVPRKDRLNKKAKEVNIKLREKCEANDLTIIAHNNINPFRHTNAKGLHLNNYGDKQLTKNFTNFIENG